MAFTSTWRQKETQGFRGLGALVVAGLMGMLALVPAVMFLWPASIPDAVHRVEAGDLADIPLRSPTYFEDGDFWLVKLDAKTVVALSAVNTHATACHVSWRPEFAFNDQKGWFRDPCVGSTFDVAGNRVFGPSPRSMDRYEVRLDGTRVIVFADVEHLTPGKSWSQIRPEDIVRP
ncbi:MAG: ubiquinol-cytochrome c reductase iron-sulfur subunit [Dehalococcoidia bacterium]